MASLLEIDDLSKNFRNQWTFRSFCALADLSFTVNEQEVFGLIGPNGAGKTTTFKLLLGLLRPTRGCALFLGKPATDSSVRAQIGFLPEQPYFYDYLSVRETLEFYGNLCGINATERRERINSLAERLRLVPKLDAPMRSLSKGMVQRVGVAQAIIHKPRLVILDEPMSGLDPAGRKEMRELIRSLKYEGATVIFSSHILPDAEALCDRVGILVDGRLREVLHLTGDNRDSERRFSMTVSGVPEATLGPLRDLASEPPQGGPHIWTLTIGDRNGVREALRLLDEKGGVLESLQPKNASLEDRFLAYVDHSIAAD